MYSFYNITKVFNVKKNSNKWPKELSDQNGSTLINVQIKTLTFEQPNWPSKYL